MSIFIILFQTISGQASKLISHQRARSRCSARIQLLVSQLGRLTGSHFHFRLPLRSLVGRRTFWKLCLRSRCWQLLEDPPGRTLCWRPRVLRLVLVVAIEDSKSRCYSLLFNCLIRVPIQPVPAELVFWLGPSMQLVLLCLALRRCWA